MTPDRKHAVDHRNKNGTDNFIDWCLSAPRARFTFRVLELAALVVAIVLLSLTYQERHDRTASRSFRAWGVVLAAFEESAGDDKNYINKPYYWNAFSSRVKEALEYLNRQESLRLRGFALPRGYLVHISLPKAILPDINLEHADLSGADLSDAQLVDAKFIGADLTGADLSGANLYGAELDRAVFFDADLKDADLTSASLKCAKNLEQSQLDEACSRQGQSTPEVGNQSCGDGERRVPLEWNERPCPESAPPSEAKQVKASGVGEDRPRP